MGKTEEIKILFSVVLLQSQQHADVTRKKKKKNKSHSLFVFYCWHRDNCLLKFISIKNFSLTAMTSTETVFEFTGAEKVSCSHERNDAFAVYAIKTVKMGSLSDICQESPPELQSYNPVQKLLRQTRKTVLLW